MLILTRRIGESLTIGNDVSLTVLDLRGTQVRIGINAPKNVPVHREEIFQRIMEENQATSPVSAAPPITRIVVKKAVRRLKPI